jgi:hypothetical protein
VRWGEVKRQRQTRSIRSNETNNFLFQELKIRFKLVLDLVLKAANRLHSEVIISRHIIPNNTKVPPSHTGVVFLPCGTEVTRERGGRGARTYMHRTCGPSLGEFGCGDIHGHIGGHVRGILRHPDTTKNIGNIRASLSDNRG